MVNSADSTFVWYVVVDRSEFLTFFHMFMENNSRSFDPTQVAHDFLVRTHQVVMFAVLLDEILFTILTVNLEEVAKLEMLKGVFF